MASCSSVLGFIFVIAAMVLSAVSYGTPFWVENNSGKQHYGLWQKCNESSCTDMIGDHIEDWFNIVRSLMSASLLLLVIDLFYTIFYFTCACCKAGPKAVQFLALDLLFVVLASVVAILIFGIKSHDDTSMPVRFDGNIHFSWSLYVAIGSVGASLLALIFFICEIPNAKHTRGRAGYEPILPTSAS